MAVCALKIGIQRVLTKAKAALVSAEGERAVALQALVVNLSQVLAQAKRAPGYPGGRLDVSIANPAFDAVSNVQKRFPEIDLNPRAG